MPFDPNTAKPVGEADRSIFDPSTATPVKPSGFVRRAADTGLSLAKGVIGAPEAAVGVADLLTGGQAGKLVESAGVRLKDAKGVLDEMYSPEQKAANEEVNQARGFFPTLGAMARNPSTIVNQAVESAPSMIVGGVAGRGLMAVAPRIGAIAAGAAGEGITAAGQNAEQVRQEDPNGTLTGQQSAILGASGLLTGGISLASGKLANKLGIGDVQTMLAAGKAGAVGEQAIAAGAKKGFIRKVAEGAGVEGVLQELPQSYQEQVGQNLAQGKPWDQGTAEAGAQGMMAGGLMGGVAGPLGGHEATAKNEAPPAPPAPTPDPAPNMPGLGFNPSAGTHTVFPDGSVILNSDTPQGEQAVFDKRYGPQQPETGSDPTTSPGASAGDAPASTATPPPAGQTVPNSTSAAPDIQPMAENSPEPIKPSVAMGLDPAAGPMSAAAALAVDSGAHAQAAASNNTPNLKQAAPSVTPGIEPPPQERISVMEEEMKSGIDAATGSIMGITQLMRKRREINQLKSEIEKGNAQNASQSQNAGTQVSPTIGAQATAQESILPVAASQSIEGVPINHEWSVFSPESGTLNVPRADMPQINTDHRGAMVNFLKARGIDSQQGEVPSDSLKPTQAEFSPAKVAQAAKTGRDRSILVSSDGYVLDGHHQWLAKRDAGAPVNVIRLDAPIAELLPIVKEFPSAGQSTASQTQGAKNGSQANETQPQQTQPEAAAAAVASASSQVAQSAIKPAEGIRTWVQERDAEQKHSDQLHARADGLESPAVKQTQASFENGDIDAPEFEAAIVSAESEAPKRPANWQANRLSAGKVAKDAGIDPKGMSLPEVVSAVRQADAGRSAAASTTQVTENIDPAAATPTHLGRNNQPLSEGGKPYKTRLAASDAKKLQPMMRVVAVKDGFVLAEKTEKMLAAEAKNARRLRNPQTSAPGEPVPAHAFIAAEGGLHAGTRPDMNIGINPKVGNRTLFAGKGKGLSMERATARLIEEGYLGEGASHNEAAALIKRSLTKPQYNADGIERIAIAEDEARYAAYELEMEQSVADVQSMDENEFDALDDDIPWDAPGQPSSYADFLRATGATEQEIQDELASESGIAQTSGESSPGPVQAAPGEAQAGDGRRASAQSKNEGLTAEKIGEFNDANLRPATSGIFELEEGGFQKFDGIWYRGESTPSKALKAEMPSSHLRPSERLPFQRWRRVADFSLDAWGSPKALTNQKKYAAPETLTAPTQQDVLDQQARTDATTKSEKAQQRAADELARRDRERKEISKASEAAADTFTLGGDAEQNLSGQGGMFDEPAPAPTPKTPSANTIFTEDAANAARARLLAKRGRLGSGIDPEMLLDGITLAGYHIEKGARTFATYAKAMISDLGDEYKPYLKSWYMGVKFDPRAANFDGMDSAASVEAIKIEDIGKPDKVPAPRPGQTMTQSLAAAIESGNMPKDNPALKKLVEAFDGKPADPARMKQAQEQLEVAIVMAARQVVGKHEGDQSTYAALLRLYESQPNLNIRTSTSIANQAYSTPAPLAYLASRLADITKTTVVLEPTGGTGMLLIAANPAKAVVNELNDLRISLLQEQGFKPTQKDAATESLAHKDGPVDAVITNPPFGSVKDEGGKPVKVKVDGFNIGQIDHLIAARALETMKEDGKAVLIIGANKVAGGMNTDDRIFFNWLYSHYNVTGHFEVNGDLYTRQGAGWPVRVIAIDGRQKSSKFAPIAGTIQRADNWSQVYDQYKKILDSNGRSDSSAGARFGGASVSQAGLGGPQVFVDPKAPASDRPKSAGSTGSAGNVAGAGPRAIPDRAGSAGKPVEHVFDEQRLNAESVEPNRLESAGPVAKPARTGTAQLAGAATLAAPAGNEFQTSYTPRSSRKDEGVLIPANMAQPTQDALSRLEDEVGDIDEFARKELGYSTVEDLHNALMGLQVDSVAMAIHQIKQGKALIISDQTGIGKGRQAASIIRWTAKQGMTPVFVSVKPSLFTDMYGDLADIGTHDVNPFIMNGDAWIAGDGGAKLFVNKPNGHKGTIQGIADGGTLPEGSNALFMTYSQINVANVQRLALTALAPNAVFVLDESHNAAGASATGQFMIDTLSLAKGVTYLSATYAKRPDNMPLYFKTDIGDAAADTTGLAAAMASGGLPLQTVVSNNLVKAGQMFRRERSYDGVSIASTFDTPNRALHERMSNEATKALRAIVSADRMFHKIYVKQLADELAENGSAVQDSAGNQLEAGVQHTEFSSVVHNFVKQMLLGLKAQTAADEAIASLKRGEKPIIAVENTMGSFLNEYAASNGIAQGDSLGTFDYRTVLTRALARSRVIIEVSPTGDKTKRPVSLSSLDLETKAAYEAAQDVIDGLKLDIPVSPIDWMRAEIARAGFNVAEITGRNLSVDYSEPKKPVLSAIDLSEQKDKVNTTRQFNSGKLDALILNVAGSTGISLHASEKFEDQRQRHMIVAQAAGDINIFMQMLGRVHRTGQVRLPKYTILSVDLPTEKRPTAVLSVKMKSLNANTSSNTESATSVKSSDILNKYGDQIVAQYLSDNYALARALGLEQEIGGDPQEDIARKATGRLALQPIEAQHTFYDEVEAQYNALIDYLNKTNQNDLEPRTFDFDAKETRQEVLFDGPNKDTPFGEDAIYGEYSIKAQGTPMKPEEIRSAMAENLGGLSADTYKQKLLAELDEKFNAYYAKLDDAGKDGAAAVRNIGRSFLLDHAIGSTFRVDINSEPFNAVVLNVRNSHKETGNPYSLSKIQLTVAVNGAMRSLSVPATQFKKIEVSAIAPFFKIEQLFKEQPPNQRETAKIVTGNLLAAYGELQGVRGTIITFTKQDGTSEQGILLPKLFDYSKNTRGDYRLATGADALKFLQTSENKDIGRFGIMSRDGIVRVLPAGQGVRIQVPKSKLKGGKYFLDKELIAAGGDFVSSGSFMVTTVYERADAIKVLDLLMKKQALYALPSMADEAKALTGDKGAPAFSRPNQEDSTTSTAKTVRTALAKRFGIAILQMEKRGFLKIWDTTAQYNADGQSSRQIEGVAQGMWDGKVVHLFADGIEPGNEVAVMLHEAGEHASMQKMLGPEAYKRLVARAHELMRADDPTALEAVMRIPDDTPERHLNSELLAYMIEIVATQDAKASFSARKWLADVVAAIRAWWSQTGAALKLRDYGIRMELTPKDIAALAVRAVKWQGRQSMQPVRSTAVPGRQAQAMNSMAESARKPDQTETPAFKAWYGDWQNTVNGNTKTIGRVEAVAGQSAGGRAVDGGRHGPLDSQGRPARLYHGTADDITAFEVGHRNSKDHGWLGRGVYLTDSSEMADSYAELKARKTGGVATAMPLYAAIKNPFEATLADKKRIKDGGQVASERFTAKLKAESYDGVVLTYPDGIRELVAFEPTQVKSATNNNGDFDPTNPDIRFSRPSLAQSIGDTLKAVTVTNIKAKGGNKLADYRGLGLQFLGGRQLNDLYAKEIPQLPEYTRMVQQMSADSNEVGANADAVATAWGKLKDERQLAELMHDATLAQIDPAKPSVAGDDRLQWGRLNAAFKALSVDAQKVYTDARDGYEAHYANVREAIRDKIERSDMAKPAKAAMLERMDSEFFEKIKGVYFPLSRFGKYVVLTRAPSGAIVNVSRAETLNEAEALRVAMRKAYPGHVVGKVLKDKEFNAARDAVGRGFLKDLFGVLDKEGVGEELQDAVNQLYLASMPDLSWAKHGIHRKGTPGFSQDARRAYAQNMFHGARYLAKLRYADQLQSQLTKMEAFIDAKGGDESFNQPRARDVVDELTKRHDSLMNPKSNPLSTALTSFGFVFHLGLSPASAMVNLSQTALVAYPIMGAKWGFDKAAAALAVAGKQAASNRNDISSALSPDERRAYDAAVNAGTIDVTNAHDLAGISQGEDSGVMWKLRPVMKWASFLFHHAERFNRQVTFVASYRLARAAGDVHDVAFEKATKATYDGHFDYASSNRPRVMQGSTAKVVLLFKQFGQNMIYTITRQAQLAIKAETPEGRKEARKALGGLLAMHAAGAGVLGLPMVTTLLAAASMLGGGDDEPWDAETALRNMLADAFGQKPAEVMARGFSRLTPWDISSRVGLDKLILPDIQEGLEGQRLAESAMAAALGPVAGIGINALKGMQEISGGDYARGLESMMPAALRGPMKALRYEQEGAKDRNGIVIKDEVGAAGLLGQVLGFGPSEVRNATEGRSAILSADKRLSQRRANLMDEFAHAYMKKDDEEVAQARADIQAFNTKNPTRQIHGLQMMQSVRNRQKRIDQARDGIYLSRKHQDAMDAGQFSIAK